MKNHIPFLLILLILSSSCDPKNELEKPNIILIMTDDMGYECLSAYGSTSYSTPSLDALASEGILFSRCVSQPLCTPSRVKIMTGKYNYRNYDYFGHLRSEQYTFGNLMKDAGYSTCISGKWQLNGLSYPEKITDWNDPTRPIKFGFDEYCLWQLTKQRKEGERYSNPLIEQNGRILETTDADYGPDIFSEFILDFIERKRKEPFFVYYPMVLVHDPFVPTPNSEEWNQKEIRYINDTSYFKDMVSYTDKIVGKIVQKLNDLEIANNTILIFTGDNGTHPMIFTNINSEIIQGGKGNTIDAGTHVPLIVYWPEKIIEGKRYDGLIEFSDFFPTIADIAGIEVTSDGRSFYPLLTGGEYVSRKTAFVHYDPRWSNNVNQFRNQFIRTIDYKLYQDGRFFNISDDLLERYPINTDSLKIDESDIKNDLEEKLSKHPELNTSK